MGLIPPVEPGNPHLKLKIPVDKHHRRFQAFFLELWAGELEIGEVHAVFGDAALKLVFRHPLFELHANPAEQADEFPVAGDQPGGLEQFLVFEQQVCIKVHGLVHGCSQSFSLLRDRPGAGVGSGCGLSAGRQRAGKPGQNKKTWRMRAVASLSSARILTSSES